ncbi:hypothetical protein [Rhizobium sp. S96]|uniref:hypothetical protein n=1 Tax=Rhizobium sp. S96 TaxID=3055140 RepID=UPI0025AADEBF|nr:hypothetical protein [Rhizobium sp. S96]MDM9619073.1 hypothetical protein [Rhizobium sp. S96]
MVRLLIGVDSTNVGCIKIMKDNADNPYSTSDSDYAKFYFNSKWDVQIRFVGANQLNYADGTVAQFLPSGTNKNSFQRARIGYDTGNVSCFWKKEYWEALGDLDYDLPVFDVKRVNSSGVYIHGKISKTTGGSGTLYYTASLSDEGYVRNFIPGAGNEINVAIPYGLAAYSSSGNNPKAFVWNLPGDETAFVNPPLAPVAGQMQVQITKDYCRVSKPGYDVRTATASKLAFDSTTRPAKIIAAADIALPAGTTVYDFSSKLAGINVSGEFIADVIQYKGSTITFPASLPSDDDDYGANYYFSGTTLVFSNSGSSCRARFLIIAQDNTAASAGSNKVFRQVTIGGVDVFQFLRPGAANPPNLADVIIDSRWPCLQIIKTGVFDIPTGGAQTTDIAFDSAGLFPFVKYFTIHPAGEPNDTLVGSTDRTATGKRIRQPVVAAGFINNVATGVITRYTSGTTTYCQFTANRIRFFTFRGLPHRYYWESGSSSSGTTTTEAVTCAATKIRYYIFGIPA